MRLAGRRRPPTSEGGGDSYLASVSDLMSGLIFIFVIILAVFALRLAKETATQRAENERLESADRTRRRILDDIAERLENAGIKVEVLHEHGVLRLSEKGIYFPSGSEKPLKRDLEDHHKRVGHLARVLAEVIPWYVATASSANSRVVDELPPYCSIPAKPSDYCSDRVTFPSYLETLLIEGHTDTQPVSSGRFRFQNNLELSSMRAATVYQMMKLCEPELMALLNNKKLSVVGISGYGSMRLAKPEDPLATENRRIDLRFLVEPPTLDAARTKSAKTMLGTREISIQCEVRKQYEENE
jgi:chemotaxis protein MotB